MNLTRKRFFAPGIFLSGALLVAGVFDRKAIADSISFSPAIGNALTPMTVTVEGFIGTNGPAGVDIGGGAIVGSCSSTRPCSFQANMGYYSGKHWVMAGALVDGEYVVVSNSFTVLDAEMTINRACGPLGTKVIVTGNHFAANSIISSYYFSTNADSSGRFAVEATIYQDNGPVTASDGTRTLSREFYIGATECDAQSGEAVEVTGQPSIRHPGGPWQPLLPNEPIRLGDDIRTGAGEKARVLLTDGTTLVIVENSKLTLDSHLFNPNDSSGEAAYGFLEGAFRYVSGMITKTPSDNVKITTPIGVIGVRGTELIARRDPCSTTQEVYLIHGQLAIKPLYSAVTNIVDAPATIFFDATNVTMSSLTQATYDALVNQVNQTNPVTFASWQVEHFGCTNNNPSAAATADPDGDGQNNLTEFLTHTDPTNAASVFRLISGTREGNGVRLLWKTHGGITNTVQSASSIGGTYSNISSNIIILGDDDVITNFFDPDIATNAPERFYRVRLAP